MSNNNFKFCRALGEASWMCTVNPPEAIELNVQVMNTDHSERSFNAEQANVNWKSDGSGQSGGAQQCCATHLHPRLCSEGTARPLGTMHALKAKDADQQPDTPLCRPRTKIGHEL